MTRWQKLWIRVRWGTSWDGVIVAGILVALLGVAVWQVRQEHLAKATVGEPCYEGQDCRSGDCLELWKQSVLPIVAERRGGVCTHTCDADADCPSTMTCGAVQEMSGARAFPDGPMPLPNGEPSARACVPRSP